jgi:hypothetical protein
MHYTQTTSYYVARVVIILQTTRLFASQTKKGSTNVGHDENISPTSPLLKNPPIRSAPTPPTVDLPLY